MRKVGLAIMGLATAGLILFALTGCCNPAFITAAEEYHDHSSRMIKDYVIDGKPVPNFTDEEKADLQKAQDKFKAAIEAEKE